MTMTSRPLLWSLVGLVSLVTGVTSQAIPGAQDGDCPADLVTFEVITGEYFTTSWVNYFLQFSIS